MKPRSINKGVFFFWLMINSNMKVGREERNDSLAEVNIYPPYNHHQTLHEMHLKMQVGRFCGHRTACLQQSIKTLGYLPMSTNAMTLQFGKVILQATFIRKKQCE